MMNKPFLFAHANFPLASVRSQIHDKINNLCRDAAAGIKIINMVKN